MTWTSHYLRTATEAEMLAALEAAGMIVEDEISTSSHTHALDVIGEIPGKIGWHANLRASEALHPALADIEIPAPAQPVRVWA